MASRTDTAAVDVTWDDQRNICTFGRIHRRYMQLAEIIKRKQTEVENLDDASDEVLIADDVKMVYGESFITVDSDVASDMLSAKVDTAKEELQKLNDEKEHLDEQMGKLKAQLYAKFGSQIYLENE